MDLKFIFKILFHLNHLNQLLTKISLVLPLIKLYNLYLSSQRSRNFSRRKVLGKIDLCDIPLLYYSNNFFKKNLHPSRPPEDHLIIYCTSIRWIKQNFFIWGIVLVASEQTYWCNYEIGIDQGIEQAKKIIEKAFRREIVFELNLKW